jgi:hypothetical protein
MPLGKERHHLASDRLGSHFTYHQHL